MSTPVLTKRQQKHSLSAKKTPIKGLRNVLAQPHDNYWPIIETDKSSVLEEALRKLTPLMKRPIFAIPWSQRKHMKKEERAQARKETLEKQGFTPDKDVINSIVLGINAVTRSLEKNSVCCVLLDANVEPALLIRHIILMAQNKKLPIVLIPSLKSVTLNTIGVPSAAFALKNTVVESKDHQLNPLYQSIVDIFKDIPPPKKSLQLFKDNTVLDEDTEMSVDNESKTNTSEPEKFTLSTNVYKYRTSAKERAFVPPSEGESPSAQKMECEEFISLANYDSECADEADDVDTRVAKRYVTIHDNEDSGKRFKKSTNVARYKQKKVNDKGIVLKNSTDVKYLSLKVKRLNGNSNRAKATKVSKQKKK